MKICADTNNQVKDVKNQVKLGNQCGAYRNLVYELLDENGDPITEAYSITENFSNYSSSPSSSAPSSDTKNISANGIINDTMYIGKTLPACLGSDDFESFNQTFVVTMNGQTYNLTTVVQVTRGRTNGAYYVDVVTATP